MSSQGPFNFTQMMCCLCADIAARLDEFQHIRMEQVAVSFAQTRRPGSYGLQAKLTPMRFENGACYCTRGQKTWTVQKLFRADCEILYILTFYLPRFLNQTFREKMLTVFHELYHISLRFDGDIRRMEGRYHAHTHSQKEYDQSMEAFLETYLVLEPPAELYEFLKYRFETLQSKHGGIIGVKIPIPKLIPITQLKSA